jgi:hypothetical protein
MIVIDVAQGTDAWYQARLGRPTGSVYSDVLAKGTGITRRKLVVKLALELVTQKPAPSIFKNQAMLDGTEREPFARALYESSRGVFVDEVGFCQHDTIFTGVSPDGLIGKDGMCEFKCPVESTHRDYMQRKDEPPEYRAQIQGQLWVAEREWCDFASYHPDYPENAQLIVRRVFRNEDYIKNLEAEIIRFNEEVLIEAESIRNYKEAA